MSKGFSSSPLSFLKGFIGAALALGLTACAAMPPAQPATPVVETLPAIDFEAMSASVKENTPEPRIVYVERKPKVPVLGWSEFITVENVEGKVRAKLDSGATTSSLNADVIRTFTKDDGKEYVLFRVKLGETEETFEAPVTRWVKIKSKTDADKSIRRPVVEMHFCLGETRVHGEVNLANRAHFDYPILIGRNMLKGAALVDSSKRYTTEPACKE